MTPGDRCLECGFAYDEVGDARVGGRRIRAIANDVAAALRAAAGDEAIIRSRPSPWTWSVLEYACHVRDVLSVYTSRIERTTTEERPVLASMNRDERALADRYNEDDPAAVSDAIERNADVLASVLARLGAEDWAAVAVAPSGGNERDVAWMTANVVHELHHHLGDISRVRGMLTR